MIRRAAGNWQGLRRRHKRIAVELDRSEAACESVQMMGYQCIGNESAKVTCTLRLLTSLAQCQASSEVLCAGATGATRNNNTNATDRAGNLFVDLVHATSL